VENVENIAVVAAVTTIFDGGFEGVRCRRFGEFCKFVRFRSVFSDWLLAPFKRVFVGNVVNIGGSSLRLRERRALKRTPKAKYAAKAAQAAKVADDMLLMLLLQLRIDGFCLNCNDWLLRCVR
jgi:hypothetical protein